MNRYQIPEPDRSQWEAEMLGTMGAGRSIAYDEAFVYADGLVAAQHECGEKFQDHGERILAFLAIREARAKFIDNISELQIDYITLRYQREHPTER